MRGDTFIPIAPAAKIVDVAKSLMKEKDLPIVYTGIRPGEKIHEILVSEEECFRTIKRGNYYVILPVLPELRIEEDAGQYLKSEYSSKDNNIGIPELQELLGSADNEIKEYLT